jgi:hypothetical protein
MATVAASPPPLTPEEMESFERNGFVVVTLPLSADELAAAAAAWRRNTQPGFDDPGFVQLIAHPGVEAIAKQVLRSERVYVLEGGRSERPAVVPEDAGKVLEFPTKHGHATEWSNGLHSDVQVTSGDFDATPRREHLGIWIWMDDVVPERAAIRVLPGSHRTLGRHWERALRHHTRGHPLPPPVSRMHAARANITCFTSRFLAWLCTPCCALPPRFPCTTPERWSAVLSSLQRSGQHGSYEGDYDQLEFSGQEPFPVSAKRGQALVFTQGEPAADRFPHLSGRFVFSCAHHIQ